MYLGTHHQNKLFIGRIRLSVSTVNHTYELSGITHVASIWLGPVLTDHESVPTARWSPVNTFLRFAVTGPSQMKSVRTDVMWVILCYWSHILSLRKSNDRPISQIPECTSSISHNAPFRTEMCTFLFWMKHCGIWNWCIQGFVAQVHYLVHLGVFTRVLTVECRCQVNTGVAVTGLDSWIYFVWKNKITFIFIISRHLHETGQWKIFPR